MNDASCPKGFREPESRLYLHTLHPRLKPFTSEQTGIESQVDWFLFISLKPQIGFSLKLNITENVLCVMVTKGGLVLKRLN